MVKSFRGELIRDNGQSTSLMVAIAENLNTSNCFLIKCVELISIAENSFFDFYLRLILKHHGEKLILLVELNDASYIWQQSKHRFARNYSFEFLNTIFNRTNITVKQEWASTWKVS